MRHDRQELLPLALARQKIGDVVDGHDPRRDLAICAVHRRRADLQVPPVARVAPAHEELAACFLAFERSIQRVCAGRDRLTGNEVLDIDRGTKFGECLKLRDPEYFLRPRIGLVAAVGPGDEDPVAEGVE